MSMKAGIAGAGLMGRLMAVALAKRGWTVSLYDAGDAAGGASCSWVGAGMLAPSCELESAEADIARLGDRSLDLWPELLETLEGDVSVDLNGSLVVAHPTDREELGRLEHRVISERGTRDALRRMGPDGIAELEPALAGRFSEGLFFAREGHIDNRRLLGALGKTLDALKVNRETGQCVDRVTCGCIAVGNAEHRFDLAVDCRGLGARPDLPELRGVRGELIYVQAPDVSLSRPVRIMHPRYPLYIVPRADHVFVIGATAIESDHRGPITVRSALELLTAAYAVHPGFAEGSLLETLTQCRPAFPDNRPRIYTGPKILRINGLYRHGFLLAPSLLEIALEIIESSRVPETAAHLVIEEPA